MIEFPSPSWTDYELLDSGAGEKLERFGAYVLSRPEPKALWDKSMPQAEWDRLAHTRFKPGAGFGKAGKEDSGTWERLRRMDDQWRIRYPLCTSLDQREIKERSDTGGVGGSAPRPLGVQGDKSAAAEQRSDTGGVGGSAPRPLGVQGDSRPSGRAEELALRLGLTSFKHVGVFPEQAPNWEFIYRKCRSMEKPRVLNLFAYTGGASLAARAGGAEVTHLDSVRQVVTWASGNYERTLLTSGGFRGSAPRPLGVQGDSSRLRPSGIRWVVEDAMKFARREARRGNRYDGIILDPPAYGHGPDGEKWKLDECLFEMLRTVAQILAPGGFMVLNLYSNGYSAALGETLVRQAFSLPHQSQLDNSCSHDVLTSGELALRDSFGKVLPLSIVVRLEL